MKRAEKVLQGLFSITLGRRYSHHHLIQQQLELVTQSHGTRDALLIFGRMLASQQDLIDGCDLLSSLVMSRKEVDLLCALTIHTSQGLADVRS